MSDAKEDRGGVKQQWLTHIAQTVSNTLDKLQKNKDRVLTVQEVSKLIDVHEKLSDSQAGSKEFWEMIRQIREDKLADKNATAPSASPRKRTSRNKPSQVSHAK